MTIPDIAALTVGADCGTLNYIVTQTVGTSHIGEREKDDSSEAL
jgi:hypothetical protein